MNFGNKLFSYDVAFSKGQLCTESAEFRQVAELSLIRGGEITPHIQYCDEITYVISGKAMIYSGDDVREMTAGEIHYIRNGQYHRIVASENENFHYYCIGFQPNSAYAGLQTSLKTIHSYPFFYLKDDGTIKSLFDLLINEFYLRDEESALMIHHYFCQMLIQLYRIFTGRSKNKLTKDNSETSNDAVFRILQYINREHIHLTSVKQIAEGLSYSECYISHVFKEKIGTTVKDYLMQKKIATAAGLLKNSNMTITEIAEHLHFSSLHVFGLAFKRYTNTSASEFRRAEDDCYPALFQEPSPASAPPQA